jgi:hypothetical protein
MCKRIFLTAVILFLVLPAIAFSQLKSQNPRDVHFPSALTRGYGQSGGLFSFLGLDANKFRMSHSYTLSFANLGGQGFSQGVYLNTMSYQFSTPLTLSLQWGLLHKPFESAGMGSPFQGGFFVSRANLDYKPSENFHIGIQYSSYPNSGYSNYRRPFGYGYRSMLDTRSEEDKQ